MKHHTKEAHVTSVLLVHKLFGAAKRLSHIGLGVAAVNTQKVLRREGLQANIIAISSSAELAGYLDSREQDKVIISAPWIPTVEIASLAEIHPETHFAICCHSNVGFLQADRNGVKLIRELLDLEQTSHNVHLAGNSKRFCDWIKAAFGKPCAWLPNLYYLDEHSCERIYQHPIGHSGPLRIGIFGATRPLKNLMTAAAAAIEISRSLRIPLEIWLSAGRAEGGGETVWNAISEIIQGLPNVQIKSNSWQTWPAFRRTISHMHLMLQPSYTESFNMVTADGLAEGIPSVVSSAIDWMPRHSQADVDDACSIARVGRHLLHDPHAASEGLSALKRYVSEGVSAYRCYFQE